MQLELLWLSRTGPTIVNERLAPRVRGKKIVVKDNAKAASTANMAEVVHLAAMDERGRRQSI